MHPGRNREALAAKRDRLLEALRASGVLDDETCRLALAEALPPEPRSLPSLAPHLLAHARGLARSSICRGGRSAEPSPSSSVTAAIWPAPASAAPPPWCSTWRPASRWPTSATSATAPAAGVDIIRSPRSTGSILKPLLYASMLQAGEILPGQLVADVPTRYGGFFPQNMSLGYEGAVPAARAREVSQRAGGPHAAGARRRPVRGDPQGPRHEHPPQAGRDYGLSLILGGAEGTLGELTSIYAALARAASGRGHGAPAAGVPVAATSTPLADRAPGAAWLTLQAMVEVERPDEESGWRELSSGRRVAWKTGTSFGFRDAWAIGVTPRFAVGVWAGNADGTGRPGLRGSEAAAPILFELFDALERSGWFEPPDFDLVEVSVCSRSGFRAGPQCEGTTVSGPRGPPPPARRAPTAGSCTSTRRCAGR